VKAQEAFAAVVLLDPDEPEELDPDEEELEEEELEPFDEELEPFDDEPLELDEEPLELDESDDLDSDDLDSDLASALTSEDEPPGTPAPARLSVR